MLTDEQAALAAAAWVSGTTQRELARQFGVENPSAISKAIMRFIERYHPEGRGEPGNRWKSDRLTAMLYGGDRKRLILDALKAYGQQRAGET